MNLKAYLRPGAGAADISPLLRDRAAFAHAIEQLAAPFADASIDLVACIEGRGFLLGAAVAHALGAGIVPLRHAGRLKAAGETWAISYIDYSRTEKTLALHADGIRPGERVLIVDDWVETGATLRTATTLIERCGGVVAGIGVLMDDTTEESRRALRQHAFHALLRAEPGDRF